MAVRLFLFLLIVSVGVPGVDFQPLHGGLAGPGGAAWAQDDDDDSGGSNDDDDDEGGGQGGGGEGSSAVGSGGGEGDLFAPLRRLFGPSQQAPSRQARAPQPLAVAAQAEVVATGVSPDARTALIARGYRIIEQRVAPDGAALRLAVPPGLRVEAARDELRALPGVAADLNHFYRTEQASASAPAVPVPATAACAVDPCPARVQIGWPDIPARVGVCGEGVPVGMVDTGINERHDTFRGARLEVTRLTPAGLDPATAVHGTAVASLFVGDPASRSPGLVPGARLVAVDAFHRAGTDERADAFALVAALQILSDSGARVVNLSLAGPPNDVLGAAIARLARERDILFVAAAGNGGPAAAPQFPAAYPEVLAVTAIDRRFEPWRRAARGPHVDIAAPGVDVWAAASIRGARTKTGTSFAAPFVSAAAALLRDRFPDLSADEVRKALVAAASDLGPPGPDESFGAGLLSSAGLCG